MDGVDLRVVDQSNSQDITTSVLLQIIGEAQRSGTRLLNAEFLTDLIRLSGHTGDPALPARLNAALRSILTGAQSPLRETQDNRFVGAGSS